MGAPKPSWWVWTSYCKACILYLPTYRRCFSFCWKSQNLSFIKWPIKYNIMLHIKQKSLQFYAAKREILYILHIRIICNLLICYWQKGVRWMRKDYEMIYVYMLLLTIRWKILSTSLEVVHERDERVQPLLLLTATSSK